MSETAESSAKGPVFDLAQADREMRQESAYAREGHTARTLVRERDVRVVLIAMRAGGRIREHQANATATVHALSGRIKLHLPDRNVELPAGALLVIEGGVRHDVEADVESAFLLTLGGPARST